MTVNMCKNPYFYVLFILQISRPGNIAKISGCEYVKYRAILLYYLAQQAKKRQH